jgi:hypothetical protein
MVDLCSGRPRRQFMSQALEQRTVGVGTGDGFLQPVGLALEVLGVRGARLDYLSCL